MKRSGSFLLLVLLMVFGGLWASGVWQVSADALFYSPPTSTPGPLPPTPIGFTVPSTPLPICESEWYPSIKSPDHVCATPIKSLDQRPTPRLLPTYTPIPIARTIDLGPNVPLQCKRVIVIRRSNGEYEKYLSPYGQDRSKYTSTLKPGDEIVREDPIATSMPPPIPTRLADGRFVFGPTRTPTCP